MRYLVHHKVLSIKLLGVLLLLPGWDSIPSQGTQHQATRSITTPPGWDSILSQGYQHEATTSFTTPLLDRTLVQYRVTPGRSVVGVFSQPPCYLFREHIFLDQIELPADKTVLVLIYRYRNVKYNSIGPTLTSDVFAGLKKINYL